MFVISLIILDDDDDVCHFKLDLNFNGQSLNDEHVHIHIYTNGTNKRVGKSKMTSHQNENIYKMNHIITHGTEST